MTIDTVRINPSPERDCSTGCMPTSVPPGGQTESKPLIASISILEPLGSTGCTQTLHNKLTTMGFCTQKYLFYCITLRIKRINIVYN